MIDGINKTRYWVFVTVAVLPFIQIYEGLLLSLTYIALISK